MSTPTDDTAPAAEADLLRRGRRLLLTESGFAQALGSTARARS